jgi:hypothetical protein
MILTCCHISANDAEAHTSAKPCCTASHLHHQICSPCVREGQAGGGHTEVLVHTSKVQTRSGCHGRHGSLRHHTPATGTKQQQECRWHAAARSDCCRRACCSQMENVQHGGKQQCFASHSTYGRQGIKRFTGNHMCRNCRCAEFVCVLCIQQPHNINDAQSGFAGGPTCCCCCCLCPVGLHTTRAASCCMMQVQPAPT